MSKINTRDTREWKEFRVGDLFELERPVARIVRNYEKGDMPFVASGMNNNGISCFVKPLHNHDFEKGGCLTVSPLDGSCFWQPSEFLGRGGSGASICILRNLKLTEKNGLFIASCIRKVLTSEAGYENLYTGTKLLNVVISLPATSSGSPDWDYMEQYMREIMEKEEKYAEKLAEVSEETKDTGHFLDVSGWGEFRIGDLFEIHPTKSYNLVNADLFIKEGNTPVVVNSSQNNGIGGLVDLSPTEKGKIITFSDTTDANAIFYQSSPFIGYSHVQGMYPKFKIKSDEIMLFITAIFKQQALKMNFDYANKFRRDIATEIKIKLPITSTGEPDWEYMENFMDQQMKKAEHIADHLDKVWCDE